MPASPSSSVMADSVAAVWVKPGSANQMLPRSFFHAPASTPPLMMGISTDSPERLSVRVTLSGTSLLPSLYVCFSLDLRLHRYGWVVTGDPPAARPASMVPGRPGDR